MRPKEKAINYLKNNTCYSCGYYPGDAEDHINKALDIVIKYTKKEKEKVIRMNVSELSELFDNKVIKDSHDVAERLYNRNANRKALMQDAIFEYAQLTKRRLIKERQDKQKRWKAKRK